HVIDAGVRRRVELQQVDEATRVDFHTCRTYAAWRRRDAIHAVEAFRENSRDRRFADAARAREQIGMMQTAARERIGERRDDVLLPRELRECLRPPLPRENLIAHAKTAARP